MYLIYLDESGTPDPSDIDNPYYLLAGLVVSERDWKTIDEEVYDIKNTYELKEIRTGRIYTRFQKHSNMRNFQILVDIYKLISRLPLTLICTGVYKPKNLDIDAEFYAWVFMLERLNIIVDKLCQRDQVYTNPADIGAGDKAPFDLMIMSASVPVSEIDHYNLIASSG